ncbi:putative siderophore-binding lipoprotein YfiY precursor [compost metagenome]
MEVIPDIDADFILTINYRGTGTANLTKLTESNIWKSTAAAKNGQVYAVNDEYWTGGGLIAYGKIIDDIVGLLAP